MTDEERLNNAREELTVDEYYELSNKIKHLRNQLGDDVDLTNVIMRFIMDCKFKRGTNK